MPNPHSQSLQLLVKNRGSWLKNNSKIVQNSHSSVWTYYLCYTVLCSWGLIWFVIEGILNTVHVGSERWRMVLYRQVMEQTTRNTKTEWAIMQSCMLHYGLSKTGGCFFCFFFVQHIRFCTPSLYTYINSYIYIKGETVVLYIYLSTNNFLLETLGILIRYYLIVLEFQSLH